MPRLLLALLTLLLPGCEFFIEPPPDPALDGLLSCGETQPLAALSSTDDLVVDAEGPLGIDIVTGFDDPALAAILRTSGANDRNLGEWWDPIAGRTRLTASLEAGERAVIDLFAPADAALGGALTLSCPAAETCWNLGDDNGDGLVDCADPLCARDAGCVDDQEDLTVQTLICADDFAPVSPPVLRPIDEQRTLYTTFPLGEEQPVESYWGGAEVRLGPMPAAAEVVVVRAGGPGLICQGTDAGTSVFCDRAERVDAGDVVGLFAGEGDVWLEPLGSAWEGLELRVDCGDR